MALAAAAPSGRGRVAAFSDSTVWSSFDLFKNGHEVLLLDLVEYLNRENSWSPGLQLALAFLGLLAAAALLAADAIAASALPLRSLAAASLGAVAGWLAAEAACRVAYAWPQALLEPIEVRFQWEGGECAVPPVLGVELERPEVAFDTLFVAVQRLGAQPRLVLRMEESLQDQPAAVVVVNPLWTPPAEYRERLKDYVEGGGQLLLIDRLVNYPGSSARSYLEALGLGLEWEASSPPQLRLIDMEALSIPASGFAAQARRGRGRVVFLTDSEDYSRQGLGHAFAVPWDESRKRYETVYYLLGDVMGLRRNERRVYRVLE
jgi:hypothetical protein